MTKLVDESPNRKYLFTAKIKHSALYQEQSVSLNYCVGLDLIYFFISILYTFVSRCSNPAER